MRRSGSPSVDRSNNCHVFRVVTIRRGMDWMIRFIETLYTPLGSTGNYSAIADLHTLQFTVTHALEFSVFTSHILATDFDTRIIPVSL
jgi:hypothetical protein